MDCRTLCDGKMKLDVPCLSLPDEEVTVQAGPPVPASQEAALLHSVVGCRPGALAAALGPSAQTVLREQLTDVALTLNPMVGIENVKCTL